MNWNKVNFFLVNIGKLHQTINYISQNDLSSSIALVIIFGGTSNTWRGFCSESSFFVNWPVIKLQSRWTWPRTYCPPDCICLCIFLSKMIPEFTIPSIVKAFTIQDYLFEWWGGDNLEYPNKVKFNSLKNKPKEKKQLIILNIN